MLTRQAPITDREIVEALENRCDAAAGALMALCGIMGSNKYLREYTIKQVADEATRRSIDLSAAKTGVHKDPLLTTPPYLRAIGTITDADYARWWRRVKSTGQTDYTPAALMDEKRTESK